MIADSRPAPTRTDGCGWSLSPDTLIPTPTNTNPPNVIAIRSGGSTARTVTATTVPATRPATAQRNPRTSTSRRSRSTRKVVSTHVKSRSGAGTNRGSIRLRIGDAKSPIPKPIDPCRVDPMSTVRLAIATSKKDTAERLEDSDAQGFVQ